MRDDNNRFYPRRDPEDGLKEDRRRFLETATISLQRPSLFYASLRDPRVFEVVAGRPLNTCDWEAVEVAGLRLGTVAAGTGFPGIFRDAEPGTEPLSCLVVHDLSAFEQTMIAWYEWDEYVLRLIPLTDGRRVQAFVPDLEAIRAEHGSCDVEDWSFETWRAANLDRAVADAREWMRHRPTDADLIEAGFFDIPASTASRAAR